MTRVFIPSRLSDNPMLLENDPGYIANRLKASGTPQLVRAWLEGDWNVIEGAFFPEFSTARHVVAPFVIPDDWTALPAPWTGARRRRSRSAGGRSRRTISSTTAGCIPRGALVRYREWYGAIPGQPNVGLKLTAEDGRPATSSPVKHTQATASASPTASSIRPPSRSSPARRLPRACSAMASSSGAPTTPAPPETSAWAAGIRSGPG